MPTSLNTMNKVKISNKPTGKNYLFLFLENCEVGTLFAIEEDGHNE